MSIGRCILAWKAPSIGVVLAGVIIALLASSIATPSPASAEARTYRMVCNHYATTNTVEQITTEAQCADGEISLYDTYDNRLVGKIDAWALKARIDRSQTLQQLYQACTANVVCQIVVAAADTVILSKVKALYLFFKAR